MFNNPLTYVCIVFFVAMMAMGPAQANSIEAEGVYCRSSTARYQGADTFLGFLKETVTCKVRVEVEYEYNEIPLDGSVDIDVSWQDGERIVDRLKNWFKE